MQSCYGSMIKYFSLIDTCHADIPRHFFYAQEPLMVDKKGVRIGFLGYCEYQTDYNFKNCSEMRLLFNTGPAVYRDAIATRDVKKLKEVFLFEIFHNWYKILSNKILTDYLPIENYIFIIV